MLHTRKPGDTGVTRDASTSKLLNFGWPLTLELNALPGLTRSQSWASATQLLSLSNEAQNWVSR